MTLTSRSGAQTPTPRAPRDRGREARSGVIAAAAALGAAEFVAGWLDGAPSLVVAVGDVVIDNVPGWLERAAISTLGSYDKPVLVLTILLVASALGGLLGVLGARRFGWAVAGLGGFVLLGIAAALDDSRTEVGPALAVGAVGFAVGTVALRLLLDAVAHEAAGSMPAAAAAPGGRGRGPAGADPRRREEPRRVPVSRRSFLATATGALVVAGLGAVGGRLLSRERIDDLRARIGLPLPRRKAPAAPAGADLGLSGLTPLFVPNSDFYRIDTALLVPQIDPTGWSLQVKGRVDRPFRLSYDELLALPQVEADVTLSCVSNEVGGDLVGNARWQGVRLADLLERAGVQEGATQIVGRSVDDFTAGFPTAIALDGRDALVAVGMNGEPLPILHGFPARLVVPGLYGYVSATKWLSSIELVGLDEFDGYWIPRGWAKDGPVKTQSRIDVPRSGSVPAGRQAIAGVAWAPHRGIEAVEVRIDDGPWQPATLAPALGVDTWRQWSYTWDATAGAYDIAVRATDGTGTTQPEERTALAPNGADGWHTVTVRVDG